MFDEHAGGQRQGWSEYIKGLSEEDKAHFSRRNVFPFSLSVAGHEVLQLVGLITGQTRIGGTGPQVYNVAKALERQNAALVASERAALL